MEYRAVLLGSGNKETGEGGGTIKEILRCSALGLIALKVDVVICNNSAKVVPGFYQKIEDHNREFGDSVEVRTINSARYPAEDGELRQQGIQTLAEGQACADVLHETKAHLFVQAGLLKRTVGVLLKYPGLNTHSGPLENPDGLPGIDTSGLFGIHIQEKVIAEKYPYTAHTVHEVTERYDEGNIFVWRPLLVKPDDSAKSLFERVKIVEKACLPFDIINFAKQNL